MTEENRSKRWMAVLLVGFPVGLVVTTAVAWWQWHGRSQQPEERHRFTLEISRETLSADLEKIRTFASPRHLGSPEGERGLTRMAAMIEGTLGPANAGYEVERLPGAGEGEWPILIFTLGSGKVPALWVATGYDLKEDSGDHSGVLMLLSVAGAMSGEEPARPVKFCFLPHAHQKSDAAAETFARLERRMKDEETLVWLEDASGLPLEVAGSETASDLERWRGKEDRFRFATTAQKDGAPDAADYVISSSPAGNTDLLATAGALAELLEFLAVEP